MRKTPGSRVIDERLLCAKTWAGIMGSQSVQRPTELAAFDLWQFGYINLRAYFGNLIIPRYAAKKQLTMHTDELECPQRVHHDAVGFVCVDCGERKPASCYHRDSKMRTGYKSICKSCRRENAL